MGTPLTIQPYGHFGTFLVSEPQGYAGREQVTLAGGFGKLVDGTVLGRVDIGTKSAVTANGAGNAGAATIGAATVAADCDLGIWRIMCDVEDQLKIYRPDGVFEAEAVAGTPYTGAINFTVALNAGHAAVGDFYTVTVSAAAGSGGFAPYNGLGVNGQEVASAILLGDYDTGTTGVPLTPEATVVVRGPVEVQRAMLTFADESQGVPATTPHKNAAYLQLAGQGFAFR